jgi:hypothetical protein
MGRKHGTGDRDQGIAVEIMQRRSLPFAASGSTAYRSFDSPDKKTLDNYHYHDYHTLSS